ncbi:uncharacterized protein LOC143932965 [Lithobates pipiens]
MRRMKVYHVQKVYLNNMKKEFQQDNATAPKRRGCSAIVQRAKTILSRVLTCFHQKQRGIEDIVANADSSNVKLLALPIPINDESKPAPLSTFTNVAKPTPLASASSESQGQLQDQVTSACQAPSAAAIIAGESKPSPAGPFTNDCRGKHVTDTSSTPLAQFIRTIKEKSHGLSIDDFTFHKLLGEGGYGKVLLASHQATGQQVAVKMVSKRRLIMEGSEEIHTELQVLKKVRKSPFITRLYGCFQTKDHLFYVMEFLSGGDLHTLMEREGRIEGEKLRLLAAEMLCGIQYLHSKKIIHRDLKPENILLDHAGHARIADFGVAVMGFSALFKITGPAGTLEYMAPEVLSYERYDTTADYFSLGEIIYKLALGKHPFLIGSEQNIFVIKMKVMNKKPVYPSQMDPNLCDLLKRLLQIHQKDRRKMVKNIRQHPYFNTVCWKKLEAQISQQEFVSSSVSSLPPLERMDMDELINAEASMPSLHPKHQQLFRKFTYICK